MKRLRILHVDDEKGYLDLVRRQIDIWNTPREREIEYDYQAQQGFKETMDLLQSCAPGEPGFDVVIVDIKDENTGDRDAGFRMVDAIKKKIFVPIIIHSAFSGTPEAGKQTGPFLWNIAKGKYADLKAALDDIPTSKVHQIGNRILETVTRSVQQEQANFLWALADRDSGLFHSTSEVELVDNIVQRLASKLLTKKSLPSQYYIRPPFIEPELQGGDILLGSIMNRPEQISLMGDVPYHSGYWVVVSASCDLERGDGHIVTLARATALRDAPKYKEWAEAPSAPKNRDNFEKYLTNHLVINREYVLPGWFDIPFLVVDFEATVSVPFNSLRELFQLQRKEKRGDISVEDQAKLTACRQAGFTVERIASLNSPFSEQVTSRYGYKYGRVGVAELDAKFVLKVLEATLNQQMQEVAVTEQHPEQPL